MSLSLRYSTQLKGQMVFTGNTLMLSQDTDVHLPGVQGSGGTFITRNTLSQVGTYPLGTTLNYLENGSEAQLVLPPGSTVVRAELVWGGIYAYNYQVVQPGEIPSAQDISSIINDSVTLNGQIVAPDPATAYTEGFTQPTGNSIAWYTRSADVTSIVQGIGAGTYYTEQVPALIEPISNYTARTEHAGWTLAVIYSNPAEDFRNLYFYNGGELISGLAGPTADINISGFETLPGGTVHAKLFLSAQEGDGDISGDSVYFGPTAGFVTQLSGPNNAATNFFGGQINKSDGTIDTTGTFGNMNNDVFTNTNYFGGRHGWDITAVDVSSLMINSQTAAVVKISTVGDAYMVNMIGLETDAILVDVPIVKSVDKALASIGDVLTYTFTITNNSNVPVDTINFTDSIPNGTTFVTNSVTINSIPQFGFNPQTGFAIPNMAMGDVTTVTFKVTVTAIPVPNPIQNTAGITFAYGGIAPSSSTSNTVNTIVNTAIITPVKSVSAAYAEPGTVLTYSTVLTNSGSVAAENIIFTDAIPTGTIFLPGSVFVGVINQPLDNPASGINIPSIPAGGNVIVTFQATIINSIPSPNPIPNNNTTTYQYKVDPAGAYVSATPAVSNTVITQVNKASLNITKAVDKATATFGDILTYTTTIVNTGNIAATSVQFTDLAPAGTTFVAGSVIVNGTPQPGFNPETGITIASIAAGGTATIVFQVLVGNSFPPQNPIPNNNGAGYKYIVDPAQPPINGTPVISNTVLTQINDVIISAVKTVDKSYADVGDTIVYTVVVSNTGNITATNVNFQDNIPVGTTFVPNSVKFDGVAQNGLDPQVGFVLPSIASSDNIIISFSVTVDGTVPIPDSTSNFASITPPGKPVVITNIVTTDINHAQIEIAKQVDVAFATTDQTITYTSVVTNTGNAPADSVIFKDNIPLGTTFVVDSLSINGIPQIGANPASGVNLATVPAGGSLTVRFKVKIGSVLPIPNPILNTSNANYQYTVDPAQPAVVAPQSVSNQVTTLVKKAQLSQVKTVDKAFATLGDEILYSVTITNTGNVAADSVNFIDLIPSGTAFVTDSVTLAGAPVLGANPGSGVSIGSINAGASIIVTFKVTVTSTNPVPNPVLNTSTTTFNFIVDPLLPPITPVPSQSNTVQTQVNKADLRATKQTSASVVDLGDVYTYTVTITNFGNTVAVNSILTDVVPVGTTFVPATVVIGGSPDLIQDPGTGIILPNIAAGATLVVSFDVKVGAVIPVPNPMPNTANVEYEYLVDPNGLPVTETTQTNVVNVLAVNAGNFASFTVVKTVSKTYALVGDTLKYTVNLTNTGTTEALNTILNDLVPTGTTFVPGTVKVDTVSVPAADPTTGIAIGIVAIGQTVAVEFDVLIGNSVPVPNPMPNQASVDYKFRTNPNLDPPVDGPTTLSNIVDTFVEKVSIQAIKGVNLSYSTLDGILVYTVGIANTGNTNAINVVITDLAPSGTTFIPGTVVVGGIPKPLADIEAGVLLGTIAPSAVVLVSFEVQIGSIFPVPNPIINNAQIKYDYILDPTNPPVTGTPVTTNSVSTIVNKAIIELTKKVNKDYADFGGIITYTVDVKNTGNVDATNVIVKDSIPSGTTFVAGSVLVGGVSMPSASPVTGITVPLVIPGQTISVSFSVQVGNVLPVPNPIPNLATSTYEFKINPTGLTVTDSSNPSNIVTTQVNHGEITVVKSVDKAFADVNQELTYSFVITSVGNVPSNNVNLQDLIPSGTTFVAGSVLVDGVVNPLANPTVGINIGTVSNVPRIISFKVLIGANIPVPNPIPNTANVDYNYLVDPLGTPVNVNLQTNEVQTLVNHAQITPTKYVDKDYTGINGVITYTTLLANSGSADALNVVLKDTLVPGITFIAGSVIIDGASKPLETPLTGINVGTIAMSDTVIVSFKVQVNGAVPVPNPILNKNTTEYSYIVIPGTQAVVAPPVTSNQVSTVVNNASIESVKSVDKAYSDLSGILEYTIALKNTGNVIAQDVVFIDNIPLGTTFVVGSFTVDLVTISGADPQVGVPIKDIPAGTTVVVKFNVLVSDTLPSPNPITNSAQANYNFLIDPNTSPVPGIPSVTNDVETKINTADLVIVKTSNKDFADLGDTVSYSLTITNTGNVPANNVIFKDLIQVGTSFVSGTVDIDGTLHPAYNPNLGFSIPSILAGATVIVKFDVLVNTIPASNKVDNTATVSFTHIVDPSQPEVLNSVTSNTTEILIRHGEIIPSGLVKSADKNITTENDIINYKVEVTNSGNVAINNVVIKDALPVGTKFIVGTVSVDGVSKPSDNPVTGINVGTIQAGGKAIVIFKVEVLPGAPKELVNKATANYNYVVDPKEPPVQKQTVSNQVVVKNLTPKVTLVKSSDLYIVTNGDIITYSIVATNVGEIDVYDVVIKDLLNPYVDFVEGSVAVNGVSLPNANILAGFSIGELKVLDKRIVTFQAKVLDKKTDFIDNISTAVYKYKLSPTDVERIKTVDSNLNRIILEEHKLEITKVADKQVVSLNDIITYKVKIINTGDTDVTNIIFKDELPENVKFVENSFTVNGVTVNDADIAVGVNVGSLKASEQVIIIYQAKVISGTCDGYSVNHAYAQYDYVLSNTATGTAITDIASAKVEVNIDSFKQTNIDKEFAIPVVKPNMEEIDSVEVNVVVEDSYIVKVANLVSNEGQILSGNKLIVHGYVETSVEYTALVKDQAIHSAHFSTPFSTFIMLPSIYKLGQEVEVSAIVEDVDYTMIDERKFAVSLMLLLVAKIK